jgi:hypothetical protein
VPFFVRASSSALLSSIFSAGLIFLRDIIFDERAGRRPIGAIELIIPFFVFAFLLVGVSYFAVSVFGVRRASVRAAYTSGAVAGLAGFGIVFDLWFPRSALITLVLAIALTPTCIYLGGRGRQ